MQMLLSVYMYRAPYLPENWRRSYKTQCKRIFDTICIANVFHGLLWSLGTAIAKVDPYIYMRSTSAVAVIIGSIVGLVVIKKWATVRL